MIYALVHPDTLEVRYVGKTGLTSAKRLSNHLSDARNGVDTYVYRWIRSLSPLEPSIIVLEKPEDDDDEAERRWIRELRNQGARLTNITAGGTGITPGHVFGPQSEEHKRKLSEAQKGREFSLEHRQKLSQASKNQTNRYIPSAFGYKHTEESKAKISAGNKGKIISESTRHAVSLANKARLTGVPRQNIQEP